MSVAMTGDVSVRRRVPLVAAGVVTCAALIALIVHAWYAAASASYVGFTSGVWLALARDLADGLFYRPIVSEVGYGGTRYFPLYFSLIALLMRVGLSPLAAAFALGIASAGLLFLGVVGLLRRLGLSLLPASFLGMLALAPHWVQQTMLAVRCDLLAAALIVVGLGFAVDLLDSGTVRPGGRRLRSACMAALFLTLAFATKPTSLYGAAVAVAVLALHRQWRNAMWLSVLVGGGMLVFFAILQVASNGRAFESFLACTLAGGSIADLLRSLFSIRLAPVGGLRLLTVILVLAVAAWSWDVRRTWMSLPSLFFCFAALTTAVILGSPGTVYANQSVDVHAASVVVFGAFIERHATVRRSAYTLLMVVLLVAAYQNLSRTIRLDMPGVARQRASNLQGLSDAVGHYRLPVLSEAPEFPVIAGTSATLLDAFTLRIIASDSATVRRNVEEKLARHDFAYVLLIVDPSSERGRGWYRYTHFGGPIIDAVLANYTYKETRAGMRVYVPISR